MTVVVGVVIGVMGVMVGMIGVVGMVMMGMKGVIGVVLVASGRGRACGNGHSGSRVAHGGTIEMGTATPRAARMTCNCISEFFFKKINKYNKKIIKKEAEEAVAEESDTSK